jgi:hypothetical protein
VQILRHASPLSPHSSGTVADGAGAGFIAAANGIAVADSGGEPTQRARAKLSEALFKPDAPSVTEMKIHLMKRLGQELGIALEDHETHASFGAALRTEIAKIKMKPGGNLMLAAIERKLGFDKLGFSLDTFVNAIIDPKGDDGRKVDAALKKELGLDDGEDRRSGERTVRAVVTPDESGLYGFVRR